MTFAPTAAKYYTGSMTITDSSATSPHTVALSGNGYLPVVTSPTQISFPQSSHKHDEFRLHCYAHQQAASHAEHCEYCRVFSVCTNEQLRNDSGIGCELHSYSEVCADCFATLFFSFNDHGRRGNFTAECAALWYRCVPGVLHARGHLISQPGDRNVERTFERELTNNQTVLRSISPGSPSGAVYANQYLRSFVGSRAKLHGKRHLQPNGSSILCCECHGDG